MIGSLIKSERIKKDIKQIALCKGICSPSYLSKIENNQLLPNEEIAMLIFDRLGLSENYFTYSEAKFNELQEQLLSLYKEVLKNRNLIFTKDSLEKLQEEEENFVSHGLFYLFNLVKVYLSQTANIADDWISQQLNFLADYTQDFSENEQFIYNKCLAIYYYRHHKIDLAYETFTSLVNKPIPNNIDFEKADMYQIIAMIQVKNNQLVSGIEYADKAIEHFNVTIQLNRVIETLLIKGIAYERMNYYNKASEIYSRALEIAILINDKGIIVKIYQNLGSVNSALSNYSLALHYYEMSYTHREQIEEKLLPILSIVQVYSKLNDQLMMKKYITKGIKLLDNLAEKNIYYYHFVIYSQLCIEANDEKLLKEAYDYFDRINDHRHLYKYGIKIAEYFETQRKYRQAASYYRRAIAKKNKNIEYWEDL